MNMEQSLFSNSEELKAATLGAGIGVGFALLAKPKIDSIVSAQESHNLKFEQLVELNGRFAIKADELADYAEYPSREELARKVLKDVKPKEFDREVLKAFAQSAGVKYGDLGFPALEIKESLLSLDSNNLPAIELFKDNKPVSLRMAQANLREGYAGYSMLGNLNHLAQEWSVPLLSTNQDRYLSILRRAKSDLPLYLGVSGGLGAGLAVLAYLNFKN